MWCGVEGLLEVLEGVLSALKFSLVVVLVVVQDSGVSCLRLSAAGWRSLWVGWSGMAVFNDSLSPVSCLVNLLRVSMIHHPSQGWRRYSPSH